MKTRFKTTVMFAGLVFAGVVTWSPAVLAQSARADQVRPFGVSKPIAGQYVVVFKDHVTKPAAEAANVVRGVAGARLLHTYSHAIKGFAAALPDAAVQALRNNPNVDSVEQDQTISLNQTSPQNGATWGLDRIDQASLPLSTQYVFNATGAGVTAFIIDTGIRADHAEFAGRMATGVNQIADTNGTNDCNGHGTHVAGTVGGSNYGVAKGVTLVPVRVLDCAGSGSTSGVIAGVDWVAGSTSRPAVANMSLGGGFYAALNTAVAGAVAKGVTMVVAAGNETADACTKSPASEPSAITVGATTSADARASYSNFGTCVDIFAPGSSITSSWFTASTALNTISGTSMASPHVAGVAALALQGNPTATPAAVTNFLKTGATPGKVTSAGTGSPNLLLYSLSSTPVAEPAPITVAVKSLTGRSAKSGSGWRAYATVTVRNITTGAVVPNATVRGGFSVGGTSSCVTTSAGSCTLGSALIRSTTTTVTATVTGISGTLMSYDGSQNAATQTLINKP